MGTVFILYGGVIVWKYNHNTMVSQVSLEVIGLHRFLLEVQHYPNLPFIFCDSGLFWFIFICKICLALKTYRAARTRTGIFRVVVKW